jgi:hypothetical protein
MPKKGSRARIPDLNWSQLHETMLMLELATGQIESAMTDSNSSVEVLTQSFTTMAGYLRSILNTLESLPDEGEMAGAKANLIGVADHVNGMAQQAIIAFQFYDKLTQRLQHVCHSLSELSNLVADQSRIFNPGEWVDLQERIRSKYSTAEEREMFQAVMEGLPVRDALNRFVAEMKNKGDDIEFF